MDLKTAYKQLSDAAKASKMCKDSLKEHETVIKTKAATELGFADKKNQPDPKKIKGALMKKAIILELEKKNSLEADLDTMETYHKLIKNKDIPSSDINLFGILTEEAKSASKDFNDVKKSLSTEIEEMDMLILLELVKEELRNEESTHLSPEQTELFAVKKAEIKKIIKK